MWYCDWRGPNQVIWSTTKHLGPESWKGVPMDWVWKTTWKGSDPSCPRWGYPRVADSPPSPNEGGSPVESSWAAHQSVADGRCVNGPQWEQQAAQVACSSGAITILIAWDNFLLLLVTPSILVAVNSRFTTRLKNQEWCLIHRIVFW